MQWDSIPYVGNSEPLYFGPPVGFDSEELDIEGLDEDKKTTKGFKWLPKTESKDTVKTSEEQAEQKPQLCTIVKIWDDSPPTPEQGKTKSGPDGVPSWDEFTQTTTFHGVRYIFDKSPNKLRR